MQRRSSAARSDVDRATHLGRAATSSASIASHVAIGVASMAGSDGGKAFIVTSGGGGGDGARTLSHAGVTVGGQSEPR